MDSKNIRRTKFTEIVRRAGGVTAFSNVYGGRWQPSLVHRWINGEKGIGPRAARAIEEQVGLPPAALDHEGEIPAHIPILPLKKPQPGVMHRPDPGLLIQAHEILARRGRYDLGTMGGAEAFAAAYEVVARTGSSHFDDMVSGVANVERDQKDLEERAGAEPAAAAPQRKVSTRDF
ncbi:hypothetical protein L3067_01315 [Xanthomonas sp. PPL568]|uniref:hypothetical protein n=1 Tax=Xanthomonas indica TaxID=2912242 RepID=UPI001F57639F|nr:hypothetical protein [Xanthomonas indica]MCI2243248.1 hypothetical protein [Xanthomonas indica]